ncbi:MAG: amidohydrolase [Bacteroidaceae bacterium]|nr:amidohydrolase [Bacteroidaceae bacterium]
MKAKLTLMALTMATELMAQGVLDVHSHLITPEYRAVLEQHGMQLDEGFPLPAWSVEQHLMDMNTIGIATSVITMPAPQPYFGDVEEAKRIIRQNNEAAATLKAQYKARFLFCASLPLPDVNAAIEEAVYALDSLDANGIKLSTNVYGQYLGDPALDSLMEVLNERSAVIILHPCKPSPYNDDLMKGVPLAMSEYLAETTRAVSNMITHNVLSRYPNLRVVVPHCGAYLPLAIPRMKSIHPAVQNAGLVGDIDWDTQLSRLYYDLAGAVSIPTIKMMLTITEPNHLLYGSDYPYVAADVLKRKLGILRMDLLNDEELAPYVDDIFGKNFLKLLRNEQ